MKFSIVTPSFRNAQWLRLCIESVADQGFAHEHIIQDAGSDDGTLDWLLNDARVQAHVERDAGMYDAINRGFRKAGGDLIAHLNCDEQYLPGTLAAVADFFARHPDVEMVFGDAVAVNPQGDYLWHRKMLPPRAWHTSVCPLSTLTCGTFFRRSLLTERGIFFDPKWKMVGDSDWMLRMIRAGVRMAVLRRFTSIFTHTGQNLSLKAHAEAATFFSEAPRRLQVLRPAILVHHRLRRLLGGIYAQQPFTYRLFTVDSPQCRVEKQVARPTSRWKW